MNHNDSVSLHEHRPTYFFRQHRMVSVLEVIGSSAIALLVWRLISECSNGGFRAVLAWIIHFMKTLPGVDYMLSSYVKSEVVGFVGQLYKNDGIARSVQLTIPEKGNLSNDQLKYASLNNLVNFATCSVVILSSSICDCNRIPLNTFEDF